MAAYHTNMLLTSVQVLLETHIALHNLKICNIRMLLPTSHNNLPRIEHIKTWPHVMLTLYNSVVNVIFGLRQSENTY